MVVNDDLVAFSDLARQMGQGDAETEACVLVELVEANSGNGPKLSDCKPLFHADHGNKAGSSATISNTTMPAARLIDTSHPERHRRPRHPGDAQVPAGAPGYVANNAGIKGEDV